MSCPFLSLVSLISLVVSPINRYSNKLSIGKIILLNYKATIKKIHHIMKPLIIFVES